MLSEIIAGCVGYLIGSFPTAYFAVKWKSNVDIRKAGSGNVGTLNSFEVTNSKLVGVMVLVGDLLKGVLAVLAGRYALGNEFVILATAGVGAVIGHNFPVWLNFKGGRGLATAAGVMLVLGWVFVIIWGAVWFVGKTISKDVNVGNAVATVALLLCAWLIPAHLMTKIIPDSTPATSFAIFASALALTILMRLVDPVREYIRARTA